MIFSRDTRVNETFSRMGLATYDSIRYNKTKQRQKTNTAHMLDPVNSTSLSGILTPSHLPGKK